MAERYKQVASVPLKVWLDTEAGVSFTEGDSDEYVAFQKWVADNNVADIAVPPPVVTRSTKLTALVAQGKQAIANANLTTNDGKALGAIFTSMLDGLAQLDR